MDTNKKRDSVKSNLPFQLQTPGEIERTLWPFFSLRPPPHPCPRPDHVPPFTSSHEALPRPSPPLPPQGPPPARTAAGETDPASTGGGACPRGNPSPHPAGDNFSNFPTHSHLHANERKYTQQRRPKCRSARAPQGSSPPFPSPCRAGPRWVQPRDPAAPARPGRGGQPGAPLTARSAPEPRAAVPAAERLPPRKRRGGGRGGEGSYLPRVRSAEGSGIRPRPRLPGLGAQLSERRRAGGPVATSPESCHAKPRAARKRLGTCLNSETQASTRQV